MFCFFFRFSLTSLTTLVKDLVRLLQVTHSSVHQAFTTLSNHNHLDCFFALLHQNQVSQSTNNGTVKNEKCNLSQSVKILPLPNEIKVGFDDSLYRLHIQKVKCTHWTDKIYLFCSLILFFLSRAKTWGWITLLAAFCR